MKSLMCLLREVLRDRGTWCRTSTSLDYKTIQARVKHEGISFLTITLPSFGSDLQKGLDQGYVDRRLFQGFTWKEGLPQFLGGFLCRVFDRKSGKLLDDPCIDSIHAIRQITLLFGKMDYPCSDTRVKAAINKYIKCEEDVRLFDNLRTEAAMSRFGRIGQLLWGDVLDKMDRKIDLGHLIPRHGPGVTADKLLGNQKFNQQEWTQRLEPLFPHGEFLAPNWRYFMYLDKVNILEPGSERPVKVITVPKTLKAPRIIAVEPTCMQYAQQALMRPLVALLEDVDNPLRSLIGFEDQTPNQEMAFKGSLFGDLATLDLSDASDRVSNQLVRHLTRFYPHVQEGLDASRSRKADVPGHGVIRLAKFASMGSALCFPIEAMVFLTIVFAGIEKELSHRLTTKTIKAFCGSVRIYGDDIIIPSRFVHAVIRELEDFGLLVNTDKSFWTGKFRESCGKEYYDGVDVSIVRCRTSLPTGPQNTHELVSTVSLRNQLYLTGIWGACRYLDGYLESLIPFPRVEATSPVLGRLSFLGFETQKLSLHTHAPRVKGYVVRSVIPPSPLEGYGALLKYFLKQGDDPFADKKHLERSGRPKSVGTKLRWAQPF